MWLPQATVERSDCICTGGGQFFFDNKDLIFMGDVFVDTKLYRDKILLKDGASLLSMAHTAKDLAVFLKKKGFIYPSCDIYGGVAGLYDYGHLGTLLKKNWENVWREYFLGLNDNYFEIETATIAHENVFRASGHLEYFSDPMVKCSKAGCEFSERADHFVTKATGKRTEGWNSEDLNLAIKVDNLMCPVCKNVLAPVESMNMMFPLQLGVGGRNRVFLRPETAQSPYVNFKLQHEMLRKKMPLGLALIGRAYRNEISPRNLTLRQREFTQAELQIFFNPAKIDSHPDFDLVKGKELRVLLESDRKKNVVVLRTASELVRLGLPQFYVYHLCKIQQFYSDVLRIDMSKFRFYQLDNSEKAFYNKYHFDMEVEMEEHGWVEVGGLHYRTDHDLSGHARVSKQSMEIFEEETQEKYVPHVLECSFGVDRNVYALLDLGYVDDTTRGTVVLGLRPLVAPFVCAVFPLVRNKEEIVGLAHSVVEAIKSVGKCYYDESGTVGKRYARADEQGVPYCITVDFDSLFDLCVTVRDRDTTVQDRVKITDLQTYLNSKM